MENVARPVWGGEAAATQHFERLYRRDQRQLIGYGRDLYAQARHWIAYAHVHAGLAPEDLHRIAFDALGFCLDRKPKAFCIPARLKGEIASPALRRLLAQAEMGQALQARLEDAGTRVVVYADGHRLGYLDPQHTAWFAPLLRTGASVHLLQLIHIEEGHPIQVRIALGFLAHAIDEFEHQERTYRVAA